MALPKMPGRQDARPDTSDDRAGTEYDPARGGFYPPTAAVRSGDTPTSEKPKKS